MPLIQSGSKKAREKNIEKEMSAHPGKENRAQNLAIAYEVQRRNKRKKMARGGEVEQSAHDEKRPMPDQEFADSLEDSHVSEKRLQKSGWTDDTWSEQASRSQSKRPGSVEVDARDEHEVSIDDERSSESLDMLRRKRMAEGGLARQHANELTPSHEYSPEENEMIEDEARRQLMAEHKREMLAYGGYAEGGQAMPDEEIDEQRPHSIAAAILRKRKRMAEGGEVANDMADVSENAEESPNNEDQLSYNALRKENYSEQHGLDQLDQPEDSNEHGDEGLEADEHDMVSQIRKKMKAGRRL